MQHSNAKFLVGASAILLVAACGNNEPAAESASTPVEDTSETAVTAPAFGDTAASAVNNPQRWPDDAENDEARKPLETLTFMQLKPGMSVFEIEAGGGYFTELLSYAVGPDGSVAMQNPESFLGFFGEELSSRMENNRLANVRQTLSIFDDFDAGDASIDLVTWVLGPHELFFTPDSGETLGDPQLSYAEIFRITKPGGAFVAIDHSAEAGAPESTGNTLHRIDKGVVIRMAEEAGFVFEAEADFLARPDDDRTLLVFNPEIRGKTDQFVLRFRKPE